LSSEQPQWGTKWNAVATQWNPSWRTSDEWSAWRAWASKMPSSEDLNSQDKLEVVGWASKMPSSKAKHAAIAAAARTAKDRAMQRATLQGTPKQKVDGKVQMQQIEQARDHAEKVAESAGATNDATRRRAGRAGKHSRQVLAAFNAPAAFSLPVR
ncbi:unnamed protein product, partial [Polarella glacialis]